MTEIFKAGFGSLIRTAAADNPHRSGVPEACGPQGRSLVLERTPVCAHEHRWWRADALYRTDPERDGEHGR